MSRVSFLPFRYVSVFRLLGITTVAGTMGIGHFTRGEIGSLFICLQDMDLWKVSGIPVRTALSCCR